MLKDLTVVAAQAADHVAAHVSAPQGVTEHIWGGYELINEGGKGRNQSLPTSV